MENLLGTEAENVFVIGWLVNVACDNARQWQDILKSAAQSALSMFVLDRLWVTSSNAWAEQHIDFLSVQATLLTGRVVSRLKRMRRHIDSFAAVQ
jgi:hypothetical protein